ncbi:unnamed protein product, partial [Allacma fusca]
MQSSEDVNPELSNLSVNSNKSKLTASATTSMERKGRILASTIIFGLVLAELGCLGVTIGAHRLWSHRAFKANLPLRILLVACQTLSGQDSVWMWDPVVMWQKKYIRKPVGVLAVLVMPTIVPWLCFNESFGNAFCVAACLKTAYVMNRVFLINSAAHMWGYRPYDKNLFPAENKFVSFA